MSAAALNALLLSEMQEATPEMEVFNAVKRWIEANPHVC